MWVKNGGGLVGKCGWRMSTVFQLSTIFKEHFLNDPEKSEILNKVQNLIFLKVFFCYYMKIFLSGQR